MGLRNTTLRYGSLAVTLHWLTLLLVVGLYACIELRELYPRGSEPRELLKTAHFTLGLTIFALVWIRLAARWSGPRPAVQPPLPAWQQAASNLWHLVLYAFLMGMPVAGWLVLSGEGKPVPFWGLELPPLMGEREELAAAIKAWHKRAGTIGYALFGLHAAVGLWHHFVRRDNALLRILPARRRAPRGGRGARA
jgi:superoxide oxidase